MKPAGVLVFEADGECYLKVDGFLICTMSRLIARGLNFLSWGLSTAGVGKNVEKKEHSSTAGRIAS